MNNKIKILYVVNTLRETSSPLHEHILPISRHHDVTVCSLANPEVDLPSNISIYSGNRKILNFSKVLKKIFFEKEIDIVHFHAPFSACIALVALDLIRPKIGYSKVYTVHSSYSRYNYRYLLMLLFIFLKVDRTVHCSTSSYESFTNKFPNLFLKNRSSIPNGVNLNLVYSILDESNNNNCIQYQEIGNNQPVRIITIGRLIELKNQSLLLQTLSKIKNDNFILSIIGTGPLLDTLKTECEYLDIDSKVEFVGEIDRKDVYRRLRKSDIFISTSTMEGLPVSVLESLACKCPAILSDIPPHREINDDYDAITIVQSNDIDGFVLAVNNFMALSIDQVNVISEQSREHVENYHSLQNMNENYIDLYKQSIIF